jgi:ribose transport system ATP-binding protein
VPNDEPVITVRLRGVSKSFGETRALQSVDFEALAGEVHAIVGENGSGKSTLAKIMAGVLSPDVGEVDVLGIAPRDPIDACNAGLAMIFQEVLVAEEASVLENLYVGRDPLLAMHSSQRARAREAAILLERFIKAPVDLNARAGTLSLSIKQWIVIARAFLRRPRVLILDESSAALDFDATLRLHAAIEQLRAAGSTILIVTHRIAELVRIADRATVLRDGEVVGAIAKQDITEKNLLAMMTPPDRRRADTEEVVRLPRKIAAPAMFEVEGLRLAADSPSFSFALEPGQIVGITGLEGQGQDDFVRILAGIKNAALGLPAVATDTGMQTLDSLAAAERLGVVYVSGDRKREGIFPDRSIFENLVIGIYRKNLLPFGVIRRSGVHHVFQAEVSRFRIKIGRPSDKITSLSGGNQQKVLIARAFAREPKVIILNDPARGVDLATKGDLYVELRRFADRGGSVVYLSSEIEEFLGFADRVDVFVGQAIFRSLRAEAVNEDEMLAAMFQQERHAHVSFAAQETAS